MINETILNDSELLPDGTRFDFWDCDTHFTKTYVVDKNNEKASDENDGSEQFPFRTIAQAAKVVRPGERVLIKKGDYYETIRDVSGGTDAQHMILFEGENGAVITGAVDWKPNFVSSEGYRQTPVSDEWELFSSDESSYLSKTNAMVYMGDLPDDCSLYDHGYNPFFIMNLQSLSWVPRRNGIPGIMNPKFSFMGFDADAHLQKRGLMFMDGKRLKQVVRPFELWEQEDVYWVDETYKRIHLHLKNNENPNSHRFQLAIHETGFMPNKSGLGYLYFKNLAFEKFSNPIKCPQYGALSSNCGHHFIVENCRFSDMNSIGLDLGFISHCHLHDGIRGYHIVRQNRFERCGIGGLSAVPTKGKYLENMLIENNTLIDNCFHKLAELQESAVIKCHYTRNSLIRRNRILGVKYGLGIWLDKCNMNSRVTGNRITDIQYNRAGAIYNEATVDTVLIDNNYISNVNAVDDEFKFEFKGHGIIAIECENTIVIHNVILNTISDGIHFRFTQGKSRRFLGDDRRTCMFRNNLAIENYINGCRHGVVLSTCNDYSDKNQVYNASTSTFAIHERSEDHNRESFEKCYGFEKNEGNFNPEKIKCADELVVN